MVLPNRFRLAVQTCIHLLTWGVEKIQRGAQEEDCRTIYHWHSWRLKWGEMGGGLRGKEAEDVGWWEGGKEKGNLKGGKVEVCDEIEEGLHM